MSASATKPRHLLFITHAEVVIQPATPVPDWPLSPKGRARHALFNANPATAGLTSVYASTERKAAEAAAILVGSRGLALHHHQALHENDRTATGYLPPPEFERTADAFFANPTVSIRGWERAADAQQRIVEAVERIIRDDQTGGDVAVVAHGGVGALLLAHFLGERISRQWDQPGNGGGNYFTLDMAARTVVSRWVPIG